MTEPGDLGRRVRARRVELGLSRDELAAAAGMSSNHVRYFEENVLAAPSPGAVLRLAAALRTDESHLRGNGSGPLGSEAHVGGPATLEVLDEATCRRLLQPGGVARAVFADATGPVALPVDVVVVGPDLVFRTAGDGALAAAVSSGGPISIELDHLDPVLARGWSVLVRGPATADPPGTSGAPTTGSWAGAARTTTVRLRPVTLTGRRVTRMQETGSAAPRDQGPAPG